MLPHELTVPVQVLFASLTNEGVVLDCTLAAEVVTGNDQRIPSGSPFSLLIDGPTDGSGGTRPAGPDALGLLERWSSDGVVVEATTSATDKCLVLCHDEERLVLEIL